jgi:hypothetical protein
MRMLLGVSILVAVVAAIDAARGAHWDQFALLCVLGALSLIALVGAGRSVRPRPDLMNWVEQQSAVTDDDPNRVVDRALAAYQAQMLPDADDGPVDP